MLSPFLRDILSLFCIGICRAISFFVVNFAKSLGNSDALARVEKGLAEKPSSSFLASFPRVNKCT